MTTEPTTRRWLVTYEVTIREGDTDPWDSIREQIGSGTADMWDDPVPATEGNTP